MKRQRNRPFQYRLRRWMHRADRRTRRKQAGKSPGVPADVHKFLSMGGSNEHELSRTSLKQLDRAIVAEACDCATRAEMDRYLAMRRPILPQTELRRSALLDAKLEVLAAEEELRKVSPDDPMLREVGHDDSAQPVEG